MGRFALVSGAALFFLGRYVQHRELAPALAGAVGWICFFGLIAAVATLRRRYGN